MNKKNNKIKKNRKIFLSIAKKFFDEHGLELNSENGKQIPLDSNCANPIAQRDGWSINVFILTKYGIAEAYYRGKDPNFTIAKGFPNLYLKDVKMESNKFLYSIEELIPLVEHLKLT